MRAPSFQVEQQRKRTASGHLYRNCRLISSEDRAVVLGTSNEEAAAGDIP